VNSSAYCRRGSQQAASLRYFHHDQLGSVAAVTDEVGNVIERLAYDPWGKRRGADGVADVTDSLVGLSLAGSELAGGSTPVGTAGRPWVHRENLCAVAA
jgi:hypothetical protein